MPDGGERQSLVLDSGKRERLGDVGGSLPAL